MADARFGRRRRCCNKPDYTVTRYQGDTAFFNAEQKALDLLAAKKAPRHRRPRLAGRRQRQRHLLQRGDAPRHDRRPLRADQSRRRPGGHQGHRSRRLQPRRALGERDERTLPREQRRDVVPRGRRRQGRASTAPARRTPRSTRAADRSRAATTRFPTTTSSISEAKRTGNNTIVARPAVLYIKDIPVMWLPFIFSDTRSGRHSGILAPQFGVGDIVRNSPTYRRNVDHAGYYWALNDYMDFGTWLDWRSSAGAHERRSGLDYATTPIGTTSGSIAFLAVASASDYTQADRTHADEPRDQLVAQSGLLARRSPEHEPQLRHEHDAAAAKHVQSVSRRSRRSRRRRPIRTSSGRRRSPSARRANSIRDAMQVDQTLPTLSTHDDADHARDMAELDADAELQPERCASTSTSRALARTIFRINPVTGAQDSVRHQGSQLVAIRRCRSTRRFRSSGRDIKNSFRVTQQRNDFAAAGRDLRSQHRAGDREPRLRRDLSHRRRLDAGVHASRACAQQVQPDAERQPAERRPGTVLGGERADERALRASVQATDLRTLGVADDLRPVSRLRSVRALPPLDHAVDRLQLRAGVAASATSTSSRSVARGRATSAICDRTRSTSA